jgi:hypothetical protein
MAGPASAEEKRAQVAAKVAEPFMMAAIVVIIPEENTATDWMKKTEGGRHKEGSVS